MICRITLFLNKKKVHGLNKYSGTLVMLLFNFGFSLLIKILSFTCKIYGFFSRPIIVKSLGEKVFKQQFPEFTCCIGAYACIDESFLPVRAFQVNL